MSEQKILSEYENNQESELVTTQLICAGKEKYALPRENISELIRIAPEEIKDKLSKVGSASVLRLRGELVPVVDLAEILGLEKFYTEPETGEFKPDKRKNIADRRSKQYLEEDKNKTDAPEKPVERSAEDRRKKSASALNFVVVVSDSFKYAILAESFGDSTDLEVRPPGEYIKKSRLFSGVTVSKGEKPVLMLDVEAVADKAGLKLNSELKRITESEKESTDQQEDLKTLLTFKNSNDEYFAVSLDNVQRIERIKSLEIENPGQKKIVKYRGGVLSLFELSDIFKAKKFEYEEFTEVIVFKVNGRDFGITAKPPVDIQEVVFDLDDKTLVSKGIRGSLPINGKTSLLIDIYEAKELLDL
ncbi:MAG: chemotaxis protein CheW [Thermodesulfobacteriota bacterium]